ncbi:MAG: hypothetical protein AAFR02_00595 [Pseudomonadota bacterium]
MRVDLPDIPAGGEIYVQALKRLGFLDQSSMQSTALSYTEIAHGCPWATEQDRHIIRSMSAAYLRGVTTTNPFGRSPIEIERKRNGL